MGVGARHRALQRQLRGHHDRLWFCRLRLPSVSCVISDVEAMRLCLLEFLGQASEGLVLDLNTSGR